MCLTRFSDPSPSKKRCTCSERFLFWCASPAQAARFVTEKHAHVDSCSWTRAAGAPANQKLSARMCVTNLPDADHPFSRFPDHQMPQKMHMLTLVPGLAPPERPQTGNFLHVCA